MTITVRLRPDRTTRETFVFDCRGGDGLGADVTVDRAVADNSKIARWWADRGNVACAREAAQRWAEQEASYVAAQLFADWHKRHDGQPTA